MHPLSSSLIRRAPPALRRPVEVAIRTVDNAIADRIPGLAAETAFWVLLSLPALLVALIAAIAEFTPRFEGQDWQEELVTRVVEVSSVALTPNTIDSVERVLRSLLEDSGAGVVSTAFISALWVASRAVRTILTTTALVYGRGKARVAWKQRLVGLSTTVGALVFGTIIAPLLLAGPGFAEQLETWIGQDLGPLVPLWRAAYWPTVVLGGAGAIALLYRIAVPGTSRWRFDLPGAFAAVGVWLLGSAGLRLYGAWLAEGNSAYGPLAGPIVALIWLWLTALAVLFGAELNAQLEGNRNALPAVPAPGPDHDAQPIPAGEQDHEGERGETDPDATQQLSLTERDERRS